MSAEAAVQEEGTLEQVLNSSTVDLDVLGDEWSELLRLGPDAFARALQQAEGDIDKGKDGAAAAPAAGTGDLQQASAFQAWAQRIAHLHILDVDEELYTDQESDVDDAQLLQQLRATSTQQAAALAPSATDASPQAQLLRYRILLAQEEARRYVHALQLGACMPMPACALSDVTVCMLACAWCAVCIWRIACSACSTL